jgi:integrase
MRVSGSGSRAGGVKKATSAPQPKPKIVAERLGHSTPMLTLTVYSHVTPTMQRAAADELDAVLTSRS